MFLHALKNNEKQGKDQKKKRIRFLHQNIYLPKSISDDILLPSESKFYKLIFNELSCRMISSTYNLIMLKCKINVLIRYKFDNCAPVTCNLPHETYLCRRASYLCLAKFKIHVNILTCNVLRCAINMLCKTKSFKEFRFTGKKFFHSIKL